MREREKRELEEAFRHGANRAEKRKPEHSNAQASECCQKHVIHLKGRVYCSLCGMEQE